MVHVEQMEEQVVEVPIEEHGYIEYQQVEDEERPSEYVITDDGTLYTPTSITLVVYEM